MQQPFHRSSATFLFTASSLTACYWNRILPHLAVLPLEKLAPTHICAQSPSDDFRILAPNSFPAHRHSPPDSVPSSHSCTLRVPVPLAFVHSLHSIATLVHSRSSRILASPAPATSITCSSVEAPRPSQVCLYSNLPRLPIRVRDSTLKLLTVCKTF
jgi:hypothetical protein